MALFPSTDIRLLYLNLTLGTQPCKYIESSRNTLLKEKAKRNVYRNSAEELLKVC